MDRAERRVERRHPSHFFLPWAEAPRPDHIPLCTDPRAQGFASFACETLEPYLPPCWRPPYYPATARRYLLTWCMGLRDRLGDQSTGTGVLLEERLAQADHAVYVSMDRWLQGVWGYRNALRDLLWYLETGPRCVSAALWLHDTAATGSPLKRG